MDAAASEAHKCTFTLQIDAAVDAQAFAAPSFRFRFLEGSKRQTPVVGAAGWSLLASPAGASEGDSPRDVVPGALVPPHDTCRYEQVFADVSVTEAFAAALDDDPMLSFFFADHPGLASDGAAPASQLKDAKNAKAASVAPTPEQATSAEAKAARAYAGVYDVDASSLLAGNLRLEQIWRLETAASLAGSNDSHALASTLSPTTHKTTKSGTKRPTASQSLFFLLPPSEASGLKYLAVRIVVDQPLLSAALAKKLNPLTIALSSARRLPGISSTSSSRTVTRSPHAPLRQFCRPVYATLQFYPDRLRRPRNDGGLALPRIVVTPGKPQVEHVDWDHRVTFLCARFIRSELLDALEFATLTVEVHDRDLAQADKVSKLVAKWDALLATGVDITAPASSGDAATTTNGEHAAAAASSSLSRTTSPRPQPPKPMDVFAVDDIARRDCRLLLLRAGEFFPHGLASFRLSELLNSAKQLVGAAQRSVSSPFMSYKLAADIVSAKRRAKPLGAGVSEDDEDPFAAFDLTPTERLVREPGAYLANATTLTIHVTLQHPVNPLPGSQHHAPADTEQRAHSTLSDELSSSPRPRFSRMVLIIPYDDSQTLGQVARVMAAVNLAALPGVPLRSYQLTASEKRACEAGELDVVTGTQVIDSQFRTIFLEGLAAGGMKRVYEQVPRQTANDPRGVCMCADDELLFTQRLYTDFEVDLKRIKLRYPLPTLLTAPDIYLRSKVSESCFTALTRLADVRQAGRLADVKTFDLFPTAQMLVEVESKYGESITLDDIHGRGHHHADARDRSHADHRDELAPLDTPVPESAGSADSSDSHEGGGNTAPSCSRRHATTRKAPTDSSNDAFEQFRKTRKDKDHLSERRKEAEAVRTEYAEKKTTLAGVDRPAAPTYMYSGQKLRTQDALQDEMRKQLATDQRATYTYSTEFQSLAVSLVDPDAARQSQALASRRQWTTPRGFVYPVPRRPDEFYTHKDAPSDARCEDLRAPFVDNANRPTPVARDGADNSTRQRASQPAFSTLPSKDMVFGGTNADGTADAAFFRSVHLCGEGLRAEQDEALKRELADWERRLVVDRSQLRFRAHGNTTGLPRARPAQLDKVADLLEGPARSKPLRIVRNAALPSGKRVPLAAPPVTIHNQQEYAGAAAAQFAATLRETDAARFVATNPATGAPTDFRFPSATQALTPRVKQHVSRKESASVAPAEKRGLVWTNE